MSEPAGHAGLDDAHPWPGLASFTEANARYFYGRAEEEDELFRRILRDVTTLFFGQSGLGKTSILQARIVPRLRQQGFVPVLLRLDYGQDAKPPSDQIVDALQAAFEAAGQPVAPVGADETLWEYLHRRGAPSAERDDDVGTPAIVFDQFEEIFTLGLATEARRSGSQAFLLELADLIENRRPAAFKARLSETPDLVERYTLGRQNYRIVISMREDYLPQLESVRARAPSLGGNRFRITRMNGRQALEAVAEPGRELVDDSVARTIVESVGAHRTDDPFGLAVHGSDPIGALEVEPSLLSLVCQQLNETRIAAGLSGITADLLAANRENILTNFYERAFDGLPPALRLFVEDWLLTDLGNRDNVTLERAAQLLGASAAPVSALDDLVQRRILHIEERLGVPRIELIHDVLADIAFKSRTARRLREQERGEKATLEAAIAEGREREAALKKTYAQRRRGLVVIVSVISLAFAAVIAFLGGAVISADKSAQYLNLVTAANAAAVSPTGGGGRAAIDQYNAALKLEPNRPEAYAGLGDVYLSENKYDLAMLWYQKAAALGSASAQVDIGWLYSNGHGVAKDYGRAMDWFQKAAAQNNAIAQFDIGEMYSAGQGRAPDYSQAMAWYRKAAAQGDPDAQTNIGGLYYQGQGVAQDYHQAMVWYQKAAFQGDATAQTDVGALYQEAKGVPQDYRQAMVWYQRAAAQGHAPAQTNVGALYQQGKGVPHDYRQAMIWYQRAVAQGYAAAQFYVGELYYQGEGVTQDYGQAMAWYQKAAAQGDTTAQIDIGDLYEEGKGVTQDYGQAMAWYQRAAAQGDASADSDIGSLYEHGKGVRPDLAKARAWMEKSAAGGNLNASAWLKTHAVSKH